MDKVIQKAEELKALINELPEAKEYLTLKALMEANEELATMRRNIARLESENKQEEKANLLAIYNAHPLVNNYEIAKQDFKNLLQEIADIINN